MTRSEIKRILIQDPGIVIKEMERLKHDLSESLDHLNELINIIDDEDARKQIDGFTTQPANIFVRRINNELKGTK